MKYPFRDYRLLYIVKSGRANKKYEAVLENRKSKKHVKVHFGDTRYEHYYDNTDLKLYSSMNHMDKDRQKAWLRRHAKNIDPGDPPGYTPGYLAHRFLWSEPTPEHKRRGRGKKESEMEAEFRKLVPKYHKLLGKGGTDNVQLDALGKKMFKGEWVPALCQRTYPLTLHGKRSFSIVNNDSGKGEHWLAVYRTPKTLYVYDTFGRAPGIIVPVLRDRAKKNGIGYKANDRDAEQTDSQEDCGARCFAWLECVQRFGAASAMKI